MLRERAISAIQRDRLSTFLKESLQQRSGCFYYALLICWEYIHPNCVLPREVVGKILSFSDDLGVNPTMVPPRIEALQSLLHLKISKIQVPSWVNLNAEEIRLKGKFPKNVKIEKDIQTLQLKQLDTRSSALIFWQNTNGSEGHFTALNGSLRFQGDEVDGGNFGGRSAIDYGYKIGFVPTLFFHISAA